MRAQGGSTPGAGPGHTPPPGWHVLARAPRHAAAQSGRQMLQNQQEAQEMLGGSALSHCPEGLRHPMTHGQGCWDQPGSWHGSISPSPGHPSSLGPAVLPLGVLPSTPRSSKPVALQRMEQSDISQSLQRLSRCKSGLSAASRSCGEMGENKTLLCSIRHSLRVPGLPGAGPPAPLQRE